MDEWEDLIAHLATGEDEGVRVVALAAVGWEDVYLDRGEGNFIYLYTQLGG